MKFIISAHTDKDPSMRTCFTSYGLTLCRNVFLNCSTCKPRSSRFFYIATYRKPRIMILKNINNEVGYQTLSRFFGAQLSL